MGRFLLAAVMCWIASGACAADLPVLRGGLTDGLSTSSVNWQGFYVGGQAGYGSSDEHFTGSNADLITTLLDHNVIQQMGVSQWNLGFGGQSQRSAGYGAFGGYNWQWDDAVLGVEASYLHSSFGGMASAFKELVSGSPLSDGLFHDVAVTSTSAISISDMATFRGRAAWAYECFLPYAFGGVALANANIARFVSISDSTAAPLTGVSPPTPGPFGPPAILTATDAVHSHLIYGYTAGLGVDINLIQGLFMRAEWEYIRFTTRIDTNINTVRAGLGYKF
jgi:outer membrane immunogenic protein